MISSVIFDMDGVLVDSEPHHYRAETRIFGKLGIRVPDETRHTFIGMAGARMWQGVREEYGVEASVEELMALDARVRLEYFAGLGGLRPMEGIPELLAELRGRGVRIALASSSSEALIDIVIGTLGLRRYFDVLVSGDTVPRGKPAPDIYLRALELAGAQAARSVAVEDSANGVRAAKAAGLRCVGFVSPNSPGQDLSAADLIIDRMGALNMDVLEELAAG